MRAGGVVRLHLAHQRGIRLAVSAVAETAAPTRTAALLLRTAQRTLEAAVAGRVVTTAQTAAQVL